MKELAIEFNHLLQSGKYKNKADIARAFGFSRAWGRFYQKPCLENKLGNKPPGYDT